MARRKSLKDEATVKEIVQGLKDKVISSKDIPEDKKALTMGYLHLEGWSYSLIAELFSCCEKSVQRGMRRFKDMVGLSADIDFIRREVGYFLTAAENQVGALLRIARSPNSFNKDKVAAEDAAWKIRVEVLTKLQSLGFLPIHSPHISADLYHHMDDREQTPEELRKLVETIEQDGAESGVLDEEVKKKIESIKFKIQQFEVHREITVLKQETEKKEMKDEK